MGWRQLAVQRRQLPPLLCARHTAGAASIPPGSLAGPATPGAAEEHPKTSGAIAQSAQQSPPVVGFCPPSACQHRYCPHLPPLAQPMAIATKIRNNTPTRQPGSSDTLGPYCAAIPVWQQGQRNRRNKTVIFLLRLHSAFLPAWHGPQGQHTQANTLLSSFSCLAV